MSEIENKYAEILSHFTEPDVPLKPDALLDEEQAMDNNKENQADTQTQTNSDTTAPTNDIDSKAEETSPDEEIAYEPLTEETVSAMTTPPVKKINFRLLAIVLAVIVVIAGIILTLTAPSDSGEVTLFRDSMISFGKKDPDTLSTLYGVVNKRGKTIVEPIYSMTSLPGEKVILAAEGSDSVSFYTGSGASMALVSRRGREITDFEIKDSLGVFSDGLMATAKDDKWGFITPSGKWKIKPKYMEAYSFSDGLAAVRDKNSLMWGFINKKGKLVIDYEFQEVASFTDGKAPIKLNGKWGYIDKKGNTLIENKFADVGEFENGIAIAVNGKGKWGYINEKGDWTVKPVYDELKGFSEGLSAAKKDGKWGYINKKGDWVIKNSFALVGSFADGLAYVQKKAGGKFGYINKKGTFAIKASYLMASSFADSIALIKTDKGFGYINTKGEKITKDKFSTATTFFDDGYAAVCEADKNSPSGEKWYIINRKGKKIFDRTFDSIY